MFSILPNQVWVYSLYKYNIVDLGYQVMRHSIFFLKRFLNLPYDKLNHLNSLISIQVLIADFDIKTQHGFTKVNLNISTGYCNLFK